MKSRKRRARTRSPWPPVGRLIRRVVRESLEHDIFGLAAQMAFYFLLAIFPFMLLLFTLIPYFVDPSAAGKLRALVAPVLPPRAWEQVWINIDNLLLEKREGLLSFGAVVTLWSASNGFAAIIQGLNAAYEVPEARPFWRQRLVAIGMTVGLGILMLISIVLLVFGEALGNLIDRYTSFPLFIWITIRWSAALLFMVLVLDIIYYAAPNVRHRWRSFSPGALLATPLWVAASVGFTWYVGRFGSYELTYGTLAALISLMLWFYVSSIVLLLGGELNAVLERVAGEVTRAVPTVTSDK